VQIDKYPLINHLNYASASYDEDSSTSSLNFEWFCEIVSVADYGSNCTNLFDPSSMNTDIAVIPSNSMKYNATYLFSVFITSSDGRSASTSITVYPSFSNGMQLSILSLKSNINYNSPLKLVGIITGQTDITSSWSLSYADISIPIIDFNPLTPIIAEFSSTEAKNNIQFPLAFAGYTFVQSKTYTLRLTAYPTSLGLSYS